MIPIRYNQLNIFVNGLCGMCKDRIENAAFKVKGVEEAHWNQETKNLKVKFNKSKFSEKKLHAKISSVGHDTEKMKALDKVYDKLHGCCKYRNEAGDREGLKQGDSKEEKHSNEETGHEGHNHSIIYNSPP